MFSEINYSKWARSANWKKLETGRDETPIKSRQSVWFEGGELHTEIDQIIEKHDKNLHSKQENSSSDTCSKLEHIRLFYHNYKEKNFCSGNYDDQINGIVWIILTDNSSCNDRDLKLLQKKTEITQDVCDIVDQIKKKRDEFKKHSSRFENEKNQLT